MTAYNTDAISKMLTEAFDSVELWRLCRDTQLLQPICKRVNRDAPINEVADQVVNYCRQHDIFDVLLHAVRQVRERQYKRFEPYLESSDVPANGAVSPKKVPGLPAICNLPQHHPRNPNFTGRQDLLTVLRSALTSGQPTALTQAIHGLGGIGKTQLAVEYAYRHAADYPLIWWVRSEEPATLATDYAALAAALNLPEKDDPDQRVIIQAVCHWFTQNPGWLLIFDNAPRPDQVRPYLPQGAAGHVLITSRYSAWRGLANPLTVQVWERDESVAFLLKRTGETDQAAAAHNLAEALGDLPLALEQAGAYVEVKGATLAAYLNLFRSRRADLWDKAHPPPDYPDTVATTWDIAFQEVQQASPAGADLLNLCAFLAPDDIPQDLLSRGARHLPPPLAAALADPLAFDDAVAPLRRYSLLERTGDTLSLHRLVQAVVRDRLPEEARPTWAQTAAQIVSDVFPSGADPEDVRSWPVCARLLPHALAAAGHAEALEVAAEATAYLFNQAGLYLQGRAQFTEAKAAYERALAIFEEELGPEHPQVATGLNNLGLVLQALGDLPGAWEHHQRALAIREKVLGREHPDTAQSLNNLGGVLKDLGDLPGAREHYQRVLGILEKTLPPEHPYVAAALNNLGLVLKDLGDLPGAREHLERALAILEKQLGPKHPQVAAGLNNLGRVLQALGDLPGAREHYQRAMAIDQATFGPHHPEVATDLNNLGGVLQALGDLPGAREHHQRALAIREKVLGGEHPDTAQSLNNLGIVLKDLDDLPGAREHLERALAIDQAAFGTHHPNVATRLWNLGAVLQEQGEIQNAREAYQKALATFQHFLGPDHQHTRGVRQSLDSLPPE